jgi:hypothetical protein
VLKKHHLAYHYKMSVDQEQALLASSENRCIICDDEFSDKNPRVIDHAKSCCPSAKTCGKCVRGVLCNRCNLMLGHARESIEILLKAAGYLEYAVLPHPILSTAPPPIPNGKGRKFTDAHRRNLSIAKQKAVQDGTWINPNIKLAVVQ